MIGGIVRAIARVAPRAATVVRGAAAGRGRTVAVGAGLLAVDAVVADVRDTQPLSAKLAGAAFGAGGNVAGEAQSSFVSEFTKGSIHGVADSAGLSPGVVALVAGALVLVLLIK